MKFLEERPCSMVLWVRFTDELCSGADLIRSGIKHRRVRTLSAFR